MRPQTLLCALALLAAGCYDSPYREPEAATEPLPPTKTIRELQQATASATIPVTGDVIVHGIVTTSDRAENFYRSFCIEQDGAGLEIMAGTDHLYNDYPIGCRVTLRLRGLAVGRSRGALQAGRIPAPGSGYATDYIGSPAALGSHIIRHESPLQAITPMRLNIAELRPEMCGALVRIEGLRYAPEEITEATWAGEKCFTDDSGAQIRTYVRPYASFAGKEVPPSRCSLTGILQYDNGRYTLKLRDESDCGHS